MNDSPKHQATNDANGDELPELGQAIGRHFSAAKIIVYAITAAVPVGLALANLVGGIQRDIHNHRVDVAHDLGELAARVHGAEQLLLERGIRIGNLEQQVYDLKTKPAARAEAFTSTMGKTLEKRIIELEYNQADPQLRQRLEKVEQQNP